MVSRQVVALSSRVQFPAVSPIIEYGKGSEKPVGFSVAEVHETEGFREADCKSACEIPGGLPI